MTHIIYTVSYRQADALYITADICDGYSDGRLAVYITYVSHYVQDFCVCRNVESVVREMWNTSCHTCHEIAVYITYVSHYVQDFSLPLHAHHIYPYIKTDIRDGYSDGRLAVYITHICFDKDT